MRRLPAGIAAGAVVLLSGGAALAEAHPAEVCLETAPGTIASDEWAAVTTAVAEAVADRPSLFPSPTVNRESARLDISSGHLRAGQRYAACLEPGFEWTARFDWRFLNAGADQMLAEAPTTPGIDSVVSVQWDTDASRVDTALRFAGPLDIPNGSCWIEEQFSVEGGAVTVESEQGVRTSPFAEGACARFFDHLPEGGAGAQAVRLLPTQVTLPDGGSLRFVAEQVDVLDDALVISGSLARD